MRINNYKINNDTKMTSAISELNLEGVNMVLIRTVYYQLWLLTSE